MNRYLRLPSRAIIMLVGFVVAFIPTTVMASPFGQGVFGANVPFGSVTSLAINLGGNVSLSLTTSGANLAGTGSHVITVTSTDVVGYQLFARSNGSTNMTGASATIPASANSTPAALSLNSWGFNTDGSANFVGMTTVPRLIKDTSGPAKTGDTTTVTYKAFTDSTQASGQYSTAVIYTVVAENQ
ncbi:MAG: hypothetical protein ABIQ04_04570 [Candidatus Saccharimonadales bacterium]